MEAHKCTRARRNDDSVGTLRRTVRGDNGSCEGSPHPVLIQCGCSIHITSTNTRSTSAAHSVCLYCA